MMQILTTSLPLAAFLVLAAVLGAGCAKAEYRDDFVDGIFESSDGGIVLGINSIEHDARSPRRAMVLKLDGSGNQLWRRTFGPDARYGLSGIVESEAGETLALVEFDDVPLSHESVESGNYLYTLGQNGESLDVLRFAGDFSLDFLSTNVNQFAPLANGGYALGAGYGRPIIVDEAGGSIWGGSFGNLILVDPSGESLVTVNEVINFISLNGEGRPVDEYFLELRKRDLLGTVLWERKIPLRSYLLESTVFSVHCLGSSRSLSLHNSMARLTHSWVSLLNLV
ncbi:MAG: hypothetical protein HYV27_13075 [Candidatus Hydrogenedentes bacterium]|nr:hypothetical protein [Candidatus Hydrogenedentota bacterium]